MGFQINQPAGFGEKNMICEYDGREIEGEPFKVVMHKPGWVSSAVAAQPEDQSAETPEIGYRYFHDATCYELFVADEAEYDALDLPGSQIG
ncbi:MAG: hypothetical protein HYX78_00660 [Armatimonadetes bacterium]|nr:hypothetical protein [Armatimonadota bacterium]